MCLDHGASEEPANPMWSWIHRFFLMHHHPDRSWITVPDPDHPKGTHPKITLNDTVIQLKYILFDVDLKTTHADLDAQKENCNTLLL